MEGTNARKTGRKESGEGGKEGRKEKGNLREFNPVHLFFPAKANIQFKRTRVKTYKTKSTPCPKSIYNPTLSLTLKPTPSLTLTLPLTLKHYPRKNTLKQKTRIEISNMTFNCPFYTNLMNWMIALLFMELCLNRIELFD